MMSIQSQTMFYKNNGSLISEEEENVFLVEEDDEETEVYGCCKSDPVSEAQQKHQNRQQKIMDGTITEEEIAEYLKELEPYNEYWRKTTLEQRTKEQDQIDAEDAAVSDKSRYATEGYANDLLKY